MLASAARKVALCGEEGVVLASLRCFSASSPQHLKLFGRELLGPFLVGLGERELGGGHHGDQWKQARRHCLVLQTVNDRMILIL